jgi:hypothetical protein
LIAERHLDDRKPALLEDGVYWYRNTQWLNAFIQNWTDDVQDDINDLGARLSCDVIRNVDGISRWAFAAYSTIYTDRLRGYSSLCLEVK